jgi:hypothetical protein
MIKEFFPRKIIDENNIVAVELHKCFHVVEHHIFPAIVE